MNYGVCPIWPVSPFYPNSLIRARITQNFFTWKGWTNCSSRVEKGWSLVGTTRMESRSRRHIGNFSRPMTNTWYTKKAKTRQYIYYKKRGWCGCDGTRCLKKKYYWFLFTETTSPDTNLTLKNFSSWFLSAFFMNSPRTPMSHKK